MEWCCNGTANYRYPGEVLLHSANSSGGLIVSRHCASNCKLARRLPFGPNVICVFTLAEHHHQRL